MIAVTPKKRKKRTDFRKVLLAGVGVVSLLLALLFSRQFQLTLLAEKTIHRDLTEILAYDTLRIITRNHPLTFYLYRGTRRGFDFELVQRFAKEQGLEVEVVIAQNWNDLIPMLQRGDGDLIAAVMTVTPTRQETVDFTNPYLEVQQVLVGTAENPPPKTMEELNGRQIAVRRETSYDERLRELLKQGYHFTIDYVDENLEMEDPIEMVARGEKELTVVDNTIANLEKHFYPGLEIGLAITEPQDIAWAVRKNSPELLAALNEYLTRNHRSAFFNILKKRYFENTERFLHHRTIQLAYRNQGRLSRYDDYFQEAAKQYDFDWLKIAAQAYHESNFYPDRVSWAGAAGIMQLMPQTATAMGIDNLFDPKQNIFGGTKYMRRLMDIYSDIEGDDQWAFSLAAYNCGMGHISDARKLVKESGGDPGSWQDVKKMLLELEKPDVYQKTTHGYCRGEQVIQYVEDVTERYRLFHSLFPEDSEPGNEDTVA